MSETSGLSWTGWRWYGTAGQAICTDATLAACNMLLRACCPDAPDGHLALTGGGVPQWVLPRELLLLGGPAPRDSLCVRLWSRASKRIRTRLRWLRFETNRRLARDCPAPLSGLRVFLSSPAVLEISGGGAEKALAARHTPAGPCSTALSRQQEGSGASAASSSSGPAMSRPTTLSMRSDHVPIHERPRQSRPQGDHVRHAGAGCAVAAREQQAGAGDCRQRAAADRRRAGAAGRRTEGRSQ